MTAATILVVPDPRELSIALANVEVVSARDYLAEPQFGLRKASRVINLCSPYRYQKSGYYVSLLGYARGHRPLPSLRTIQEAKSRSVIRLVSDELDELIQTALTDVEEHHVATTLIFGRADGEFDKDLGRALFGRIPLPLMKVAFTRSDRQHRWLLTHCTPLPLSEIPREHADDFVPALEAFLRQRSTVKRTDVGRFDLAILVDAAATEAPSGPEAIDRFCRAAEAENLAVEVIGRHDHARVAEFDALFIRETTSVNHRTFRIAQLAAAQGLVVIDDPESILRCSNKAFLAEILQRVGIPTPPTVIGHRNNLREIIEKIGFPCVLKQPDSAFSAGVVKVDNIDEFKKQTHHLLSRSDLIVAQAFMPTEFDWRIGVLNRAPLFAAKYFMAKRHWQVIHHVSGDAPPDQGDTSAVDLAAVPPAVMRAALSAANLMGDGLYGVDLKEVGGKPLVIEVNDNPNIDVGYEDALLGDALYRTIMAEFRRRIAARKPPLAATGAP